MLRSLLLLAVFAFAVPVQAQTDSGGSLRVFLDCGHRCDQQYVKEELQIVDFLNESTQADVHVLYTSQRTASGGDQVTLTFMGQRAYQAMTDTLTYATTADATSDEERRSLLHTLTIGLSRYLARAGLADQLEISAVKRAASDEASNSIEVDPWNYWVFSVGGSGSVNGEASSKFIRRRANFSANRTTEALKVRLSGNLRDSSSEFDTGDETIESSTNSGELSSQVVKSIGTNWAVGVTGSVSTSSFQNTNLEAEVGPAVEYDFFPYSQSTRKLLTIQYGVRLSSRRYDELTIFALDRETVLRQTLDVSLSLAQKWGSVSISADASHLLTNFDRSLLKSYNAGVFASARVRLFRGFSFNTFASYNRIRDQIDLPAGSASVDEILLQSVQLPTGYSYFVNFGFTYRFGSIFNNVVNPRFRGGGGGDMIIMM